MTPRPRIPSARPKPQPVPHPQPNLTPSQGSPQGMPGFFISAERTKLFSSENTHPMLNHDFHLHSNWSIQAKRAAWDSWFVVHMVKNANTGQCHVGRHTVRAGRKPFEQGPTGASAQPSKAGRGMETISSRAWSPAAPRRISMQTRSGPLTSTPPSS